MKGFGFSLAADTYLGEDAGRYLLISNSPLRVLRLNGSLFQLLKHLEGGGELAEFVGRHPALEEGHLLAILL
jgi:hypothetical protein